MRKRPFGRTGLEVSLLGFGGMRFSEDEEEGAASMLRAYELGVNYFDTAPFYCRDRSLDIFGAALPAMDRKAICVSSKSNLHHDRDEAAVRRRLDNMLRRMKIDRLDILYMWCIFSLDQYRAIVAPGGPYEGALRLKDEGLVGHIAFSAHAPTDAIIAMCAEGRFEGALLSFNLVNHEVRRPGLQAAARMRMGVAVMNPLGGGLLARLEVRRPPADRPDEALTAAALKFVAAHEEVATVLSGMKCRAEVEENVRALTGPEPPAGEMIAANSRRFAALGESFCTRCRYCLPCPENIDIPAFMAAYDFSCLGMNVEGMQHLRFRTSKIRADACTGCEECERQCTQQINIREKLREITPRYGKNY